MAKPPIWGMFALLILVQTPLILAIECTQSDSEIKSICNEILNSNLTLLEKETLISNLEYTGSFFPDHNYVYNKNTNININNPPIGIETKNSVYIKNVWMDIFTSMPSILYNNSLYVPSQTKVQTGFNYNIIIPSDYSNSKKREGRECKTTYSVEENSATNKIYVNNQYQGSGKLVNVNINSDSEIKSVYDVNVKVKIKHYEWTYDHGWDCDYDSTEYKTDSIQITDKINIKYYQNNLFANLEFLDSYASNNIKPNFSNSIEVNFKDSEYNFYEFMYDVNYSKEPYYIYTLKATDYKQESIKNLFKENNTLIVKNIEDCKVRAFDFFNVFNGLCNFNLENLTFSIKTDKFKYKPNEEIRISIYPNDILANLTYGNQTRLAKNSVVFIANAQNNKITAKYKNLETQKLVFIENESQTKTIFNLGIFGFLNYFFYVVLRKYFGGLI
jgi:hypothetical protein